MLRIVLIVMMTMIVLRVMVMMTRTMNMTTKKTSLMTIKMMTMIVMKISMMMMFVTILMMMMMSCMPNSSNVGVWMQLAIPKSMSQAKLKILRFLSFGGSLSGRSIFYICVESFMKIVSPLARYTTFCIVIATGTKCSLLLK